MDPPLCSAESEELLRRAVTEVPPVRRKFRTVCHKADSRILIVPGQGNKVRKPDRLHHRAELMVPVSAPSCDIQHQVQLRAGTYHDRFHIY